VKEIVIGLVKEIVMDNKAFGSGGKGIHFA
jgi:hypothetical protein